MGRREAVILAALVDRPRSGLAIIQEVHAVTGGRMDLAPGALYATLDRLERAGLVRRDGEEVDGDVVRHRYALSALGASEIRKAAAAQPPAQVAGRLAGGHA